MITTDKEMQSFYILLLFTYLRVERHMIQLNMLVHLNRELQCASVQTDF